MEVFRRKREATIQFSDVFGSIPSALHYDAVSLHDFDAVLTSNVRNIGLFCNGTFSIGYWPELGDYGAVLLEELRSYQIREAAKHGVIGSGSIDDVTPEILAELHPDIAESIATLQRAVIGVVNCAPRTSEHQLSKRNGEEFYVGITTSGVEIYAQIGYFRGLQARKLLKEFYRIPNDGGAWNEGEQFRSSCVSQLRSQTDILVPASLEDIPILHMDARVAYADKFGNVRIEVREVNDIATLLIPGTTLRCTVDGKASTALNLHVVKRLTEIPEGELGIYYNPADHPVTEGPCYLELVRRVSNPNGHAEHAYISLIEILTDHPEIFNPALWKDIEIAFEVAR